MSEAHDKEDAVHVFDSREWLSERLALADKQARAFITEHPILSLACAAGVGYLAARLLRAAR